VQSNDPCEEHHRVG
jgi:hypothetical protein